MTGKKKLHGIKYMISLLFFEIIILNNLNTSVHIIRKNIYCIIIIMYNLFY